jgi:hypothetical protein
MTLSTAEGMTRKAPDSIQQKETLVAIAKDVEYVLKHIAKQRQGKLGQARTGDYAHPLNVVDEESASSKM